MSRVGVTAFLGGLIGLVAVVVAGMVLGNPGIGRPEAIAGASVGVIAFLLAMGGGRVAVWASLALAVLTSAVVLWVTVSFVLSITRAAGWEMSQPLWLFVGVFLMAAATLASFLLARATWRRDVRPMVSVMGTTLGLLLALTGASLLLGAVSLFPGPLLVDIPSAGAPSAPADASAREES